MRFKIHKTDKVLPTKVLRQFRLVFNAVKAHFQQIENKVGIGGAQVWALSIIQEHPGIGVNDLSNAMDIHQSTTSNLVKNLVAIETIHIERNGPDKRSVQIYIKNKGLQLLKKAPDPYTGVLPHALSKLDAKILKRLDTDLDQLLKLIDHDEKNAKIPLGEK